MIAFVRGIATDMTENSVIVETGGIGYEIYMTGEGLSQLHMGEEVKIHTYFQVREDAMQLYGFLKKDDLQMFKLLLGVNGVGPKAAMGVLSGITADELRFAVLSDDVKTLSKAPGIGKKTAQKLILELKDKINLTDVLERSKGSSIENASGSELNAKNEAVEALVSLGYSNSEAVRAVRQIDDADKKDSETILKEALKKLAII